MTIPEEKNVVRLARDAVDDLSQIARDEMALARIEMNENVKDAIRGLQSLVISIAVLIPALTMALAAAGFALAQIDGIDLWGGFAIVSVLAAVIGVVMVQAGASALKPKNIAPRRTGKNLRRDARALKEAA